MKAEPYFYKSIKWFNDEFCRYNPNLIDQTLFAYFDQK